MSLRTPPGVNITLFRKRDEILFGDREGTGYLSSFYLVPNRLRKSKGPRGWEVAPSFSRVIIYNPPYWGLLYYSTAKLISKSFLHGAPNKKQMWEPPQNQENPSLLSLPTSLCCKWAKFKPAIMHVSNQHSNFLPMEGTPWLAQGKEMFPSKSNARTGSSLFSRYLTC